MKADANVEAHDADQTTPLTAAQAEGHSAIVKLLLEAGRDRREVGSVTNWHLAPKQPQPVE